MIGILSTRSISETLKQNALENGMIITDLDFLDISYCGDKSIVFAVLADNQPLVFTSVHGLLGWKQLIELSGVMNKPSRCYSISGRTKTLAEKEGYEVIDCADTSLDLAKKILNHGEQKVYLITGDIHRNELTDLLSENNVKVEECIVYKKELVSHKVEKQPDGIFFFSPSQVTAYLSSNNLPPETPAFCIGGVTADALRERHHTAIYIAEKPTPEAVIESARLYFNLSIYEK